MQHHKAYNMYCKYIFKSRHKIENLFTNDSYEKAWIPQSAAGLMLCYLQHFYNKRLCLGNFADRYSS
ncbi:hypothetical protein DFR42_101566 [Undibacterium pigrum]|uniref:Uncharacterized protein n=1 Tax=Undibacterium pigrum TaxID=401470 RepID=A0A318JRL3_9BURK|nr:hypothetical protein DFR42_101566 [Undibacterium pigrum]